MTLRLDLDFSAGVAWPFKTNKRVDVSLLKSLVQNSLDTIVQWFS